MEAAASASHLVDFDPSGWAMANPIRVPGRAVVAAPTAFMSVVSPGFFRAIRMPLLRGREFTDREGSPVVVVDQTFADKFFPHADPIGQQVELLAPPVRADESVRPGMRTIVGVVPAIRRIAYWARQTPQAYVPLSQNPVPSMFVIARSSSGAAGAAIRQAVAGVDQDLAIYRTSTMAAWISRFYASQRFELIVLAIFGAIALLIAASGVYAVMAARVAERTRELGIRLALGATPRSAQWLVLQEAAILTLFGLAVGFGAGHGVSRMLARFVYGVRLDDPAVFAVVALFVGSLSLIAALVPVRRAVLRDPLTSLRSPS
jgi:hypothetical protein